MWRSGTIHSKRQRHDDVPIKLSLTKNAPLICNEDDQFDRGVSFGSDRWCIKVPRSPAHSLGSVVVADKRWKFQQVAVSSQSGESEAASPRIGRRFPCYYCASRYFCLQPGRKRDTCEDRFFIQRVILSRIYCVGELRYMFWWCCARECNFARAADMRNYAG